ncbi:hypothetical protein C5167_016166 [Papaver somniferum]|nr:hypothetical protein C5167_016166 [Papaver somniferum]
MCWLRIADDSFLASNFASSWNLGSIRSGELAVFQVEVGKFLARKPSWSRHMSDSSNRDGRVNGSQEPSMRSNHSWNEEAQTL